MTEMLPHGVVTPVVTALDTTGNLDVASQERVCSRQLSAGAHGLFVAGTTGEGALLGPDLLHDVVDVVVGVAARGTPVLVGALAPSTAGVVRIAREAETLGATGVVVTTPYYAAVSDDEIVGHFGAVAAAVGLPVLAYSIPPMTHCDMSLDVVEALFSDGVVAGLKDSGHDMTRLTSEIELGRRYGKCVYPGYEPFAARALADGAAGVVASIGNVDPAGTIRLWQAGSTGAVEAAAIEQERMRALLSAFESLVGGPIGATSALIGGIKAALQLFGVVETRQVLAPLTMLPEGSVESLRDRLGDLGLLA